LNSGRSFKAAAVVALLLLAGVHLAGAGALEQIRSISKLLELDLGKLKQGEIVGARGPIGNFQRGVYAESCFFIGASVPVVGEKFLRWNSAKYPQLEVSHFREYRWPAAPNVWDSLALKSARKEDKWLIDRTSQLLLTPDARSDLHVTRADVASFQEIKHQARSTSPASERDAVVNAFWRTILRTRNDALVSSGLGGLPAYNADSVHIDTRVEFDNLLRLAPSIGSHFRGLTNGPPFKPGADPAVEAVPYWEVARARGHVNLHGAFLVARKSAASWQLADCTYYVSDTYFMSVSLYEFFPQDDGTLVWQIDFASAPFRSFTGGLDRVFAGSEMVKETAQIAKLFRAEVEKNR
jgi:hypothetical protein